MSLLFCANPSTRSVWFQLLLIVCSTGAIAHAEAPAPVESIAPIEDVVFEVNAQANRLKTLLSDEETYNKNRKGQVRQAFGLLAVLGQTLAEHDKADSTKINGPALRDAALGFKRDASFEQAQSALATVDKVLAGAVDGEHAVDYPWNKLINMHPMMEEINERNSKILRVLRRPRGKADEPVHATTWAILALAMQADTHEVKNKADLPEWNKHADQFRTAAVQLAEAIRAKDKKTARNWFDNANNACDACHEKFQD